MLKIIVIDDDVLTRKGIQTLLPWAAHEMEIVGEAANGKAALDFLAAHPADLALVDLDMPVMGGAEFIRRASALYPDLNYVVLTVHTEFEYVQQVLRLGAIDYIAKTQFDAENFDQILDRISAAVAKKRAASAPATSLHWRGSQILYPYIYAMIAFEAESDESVFRFWELNGLSERPDIHELLPSVWVFTDDREHFVFPDPFRGAMVLCIRDVRGMTYAQLEQLLRRYRQEQFFYDYRPLREINHKRAYELRESGYVADEETLTRVKDEWLSLGWVRENELFDALRIDLKNCRLKFSQLYHLLLALESVWNASYSALAGETLSLPPSFRHWDEVEQWLTRVYEKTNLLGASSGCSEEIVRHVLAVKTYVDTHLAEQPDAAQIARMANMSYGYFSRCFHDIVGRSFSDYCIDLRVAHARKLLETTGSSIQQIAADVGYGDEKYFSRLFRKTCGMSPSEYRRAQGRQT